MDIDAKCYRHPDQIAGCECQRCDRPICGACMTTAPVGYHCPECVGASGQKVLTMQTLQRESTLRYVVPGFLVACYVIQVIWSKQIDGGEAVNRFAMYREWWRMLTSALLHGGPIHLAFNCYFFYSLLPLLERVAGQLGSIALLVLGAVGGSIGVLVEGNAAIGASGAAFAVMSALWTVACRIAPSEPDRHGPVDHVLYPGISIGGHIGGLITGFLGGAVLFLAPRAKFPQGARAALVFSLAVFLLGFGVLLANLMVGYNN